MILVGAGPGDPDLITLRGVAALRRADVVVHDSLAAPALLDYAPAAAERIDVGKRGHDAPTREQSDINALLVERARAGAVVVRLKGGDPFVFGRGGEEVSACRAAGVPVDVIPGVSSAVAAAGAAGIPLTDRRHAASVAVVTGHRDKERPWTTVDWERLARGADTVVILMGMRNLEKIVSELIAHGRAGTTPSAVVMEGATPRQKVVVAPLEELPGAVRRAGLRAPAAIVVGDVVRLREDLGDLLPPSVLAGRRIALTRPAGSDDALERSLVARGAAIVACPLVAIDARPLSSDLEAAFRDGVRCGTWFLTSRNAARFVAEGLQALGVEPRRVEAEIACVGAATAAAARELGFATLFVPEVRNAAELAEAWLASHEDSRPQTVFFPCAAAAADALPERLRAAGVDVRAVALYETRARRPDPQEWTAACEADAILVASPSAARSLCEAARAAGLERATLRARLSAIGTRSAEALAEGGFPADLVAPRPVASDWVRALEEHFLHSSGSRGNRERG